MFVEMRYYKRFDSDLLALFETGINLNEYIPDILKSYAGGNEYHLYVPFCRNHDMNGQQLVHKRVIISDTSSVKLLKGIKHGYRNAFCKMLIREALVYQNLGVFFADQEMVCRENVRIHEKDLSTYKNLVIAQISNSKKNIEEKVLGDRTTKKGRALETKHTTITNTKSENIIEKEANVVPGEPSLQEQQNELFAKLKKAQHTEELSEPYSDGAAQEEMNMDEIPSFAEIEKREQSNTSAAEMDENEMLNIFSNMIGM